MKPAILTGALTYAAARYIFDASQPKAISVALLVGALAYFIASRPLGTANVVDLTPSVQ